MIRLVGSTNASSAVRTFLSYTELFYNLDMFLKVYKTCGVGGRDVSGKGNELEHLFLELPAVLNF